MDRRGIVIGKGSDVTDAGGNVVCTANRDIHIGEALEASSFDWVGRPPENGTSVEYTPGFRSVDRPNAFFGSIPCPQARVNGEWVG